MRKLVLALGLLALGFLGTSASGGDKKEFFFKDGDTIVVMGDSITEQHLYSNYLEMWTVSRFPRWKLTFRNVGIGGDRSVGGNGRFKRDVLAHNATALTVDFGMNDGGYQPFNPKLFDIYMKGHQGIADQAKAAKIRVAWITPQPVEHNPGDKKEDYNETLEKFSEGVKEIADKNGGLFVDQFHPYWAVIKKARDAGEMGRITGGDAVHPGPAGQVLMASSILKGLGFPRLVSSVFVEKPLAEPRNCKVTDLKITADSVEFTRLDEALPFFPDEAKNILKWSPVLEDMNELGLRVYGLGAGKYDVAFDGKVVGTFSADELRKGVNLAEGALKSGPIADQVKSVWKAV
jgi:lysophospholipase L1-like esterase